MTDQPEQQGILLRTPNDLLLAIRSMLVQMDRKQRKSFLMWVKQRRNEYDFRYPQGYTHKEETTNVNEEPIVIAGSNAPVVESAPAILVPHPGIVNPQGEVVSGKDQSAGASA